jgi:hypothetical protein
MHHLPHRLRRPSLLPPVLGVLVALAGTAQAQSNGNGGRTEARRLLRAGNAAYERGNFSGALEKFEQAEAAYPSARIQFNKGQALRELGRPVEATEAFETFLDKADRITTKERKEAQAAIEKLDAEVARVTIVTTPSDVAVTVGGVDRGTTPLSRPVVVAPGTHEITLGRAGFRPVRESVTVAGGESRRISVTLKLSEAPPVAPVAPAPPVQAEPLPVPLAPPVIQAAPQSSPPDLGLTRHEPPAPEGRQQRVVGTALLAASAAFAIGGAAFLGASWSRYHDAQDHGCQQVGCESDADAVDSRAWWSKLFFGAAAAAGVGGGLLLLTTPRSPDGRTSGAMVAGHGTF